MDHGFPGKGLGFRPGAGSPLGNSKAGSVSSVPVTRSPCFSLPSESVDIRTSGPGAADATGRLSLEDRHLDRVSLQRGKPKFVTEPEWGVIVGWESRRHRKHQKPAVGSTWWAPQARGWWIAVLFAIGSLLFALGSVPGFADAIGAQWDTVTYFIGSLFFTGASFLSYREAIDAAPATFNPEHRRFFTYQPKRIDWWATAIQLGGTLYFNVSTGVAMAQDLSPNTAHQHVWRPDAIGSVCFLAASVLSWCEVCRGWAAWQPKSWSWWITLANLVGSIAFGISAVAAFVNPITGQVHNAARANTQTLIGALCFLIGAVLLLPERTEEGPGRATTSAGDRA
jgi:hypothetical protein